MRNPFTKASRDRVFLDEYQSYGPKRHICLFNPCCTHRHETKLFVAFNGETQHRFSSVRLVVFCDVSCTRPVDRRDAWVCPVPGDSPQAALTPLFWHALLLLQAIRQLEPVSDDSSGDHSHAVLKKDPTLPQLTLAFKVVVCCTYGTVHQLISPSLYYRESKSVVILLESIHPISPGTTSVSVAFQHSDRLWTSPVFPGSCKHHLLHLTRVRTVRILPVDGARPRITISRLPNEILMKIFESCDSCIWQRDLLTFALVCRKWSRCCMKLVFSRLDSPEWKDRCERWKAETLDTCAIAKLFRKLPGVALDVHHLDIDQQHARDTCQCGPFCRCIGRLGFGRELITISSATKNLQRLHLLMGYSSQTKKFFSAPPKLPHLHTLSIRLPTTYDSRLSRIRWKHSISTTRLACCTARWPALTSLTVEDIGPGQIDMGKRFSRPPRPACALTRLCIRKSHISDDDLLYLTASSAGTLAQVTLVDLSGVTNDGLYAFLDAVSRNVTSLTMWDIHSLDDLSPQEEGLALDAVVDRMRRLEVLDIRGNVASERMLHRRSEMFVRSGGSGVPVVRLSCQGVAGMWDFIDREWAGWEMVEVC